MMGLLPLSMSLFHINVARREALADGIPLNVNPARSVGIPVMHHCSTATTGHHGM